MKKVLALVLAVVLAFGMTTVAFAATKVKAVDFVVDSGNAKYLYTFDGDKVDGSIKLDGSVTLKADKEYFLKIGTNEAITLDKLSVLSDIRVRTSIDDGNAYIATKPAFVIKNVKANSKYDVDAGKQAFVSFKTADKFNTENKDFEMTITLYNKEGGDKELAINGEIGYGDSVDVKTYTMVDDNPVVNFDDVDGEVELEFKKDVVFKVNAKGQKELFLRLDDEDEALEDKYPEATLDIRYFAGNNKTFRRTGELTIPADMIEGKDGKMVAPFIYTNENGKLAVLKDAKYDSDKEAFIIKTNKLGKYVISDIELKADAEDKGGDAETNPDTGANDFVGLAVALAVVSVAGIAVAKRK